MSGESFGLGSTHVLVTALVEAGASPGLVARARADEFHDYKSPHAMPQHALLTALLAEAPAVSAAIKPRVMAGDFDGTAAESEEWARSPEGLEAFEELYRGRGQG